MNFIQKRKQGFLPDQEKFSTQRAVTYLIILIFAVMAGLVFWNNDQSERSMVIQTIINLVLLAVGYWLGASKQAQDAEHKPADPGNIQVPVPPASTVEVKVDETKGPQ